MKSLSENELTYTFIYKRMNGYDSFLHFWSKGWIQASIYKGING